MQEHPEHAAYQEIIRRPQLVNTGLAQTSWKTRSNKCACKSNRSRAQMRFVVVAEMRTRLIGGGICGSGDVTQHQINASLFSRAPVNPTPRWCRGEKYGAIGTPTPPLIRATVAVDLPPILQHRRCGPGSNSTIKPAHQISVSPRGPLIRSPLPSPWAPNLPRLMAKRFLPESWSLWSERFPRNYSPPKPRNLGNSSK